MAHGLDQGHLAPPACIACGGSRHAPRYRGHDQMHDVPGTYEVLECAACGLLRVWPPPSAEDLARHYPSTYYTRSSVRSGAPPGTRLARARRSIAVALTRARFDPTMSRPSAWAGRLVPLGCYIRGVPVQPGARLLDVGCGDGAFLDLARDLGLDPSGTELDSEAAAAAREKGYDVREGDLQQAGYTAETMDIVTVNHTLEHLRDPVATLTEARRILRPGGVLIVQVPNTASLAHRMFRQHWVALDIPRHLFGFSRGNLDLLLGRCGFVVERHRWVGTPLQFRGSLRYAFNVRRSPPRLLSDPTGIARSRVAEAALLPPTILLNLLRAGDAIEMFARKPRDAQHTAPIRS